MSLGNEMFEWRKQMVEKLLLNGIDAQDLENQLRSAEKLIFGNHIIEVKLECAARHLKELVTILNEFCTKNGCTVNFVDYEQE